MKPNSFLNAAEWSSLSIWKMAEWVKCFWKHIEMTDLLVILKALKHMDIADLTSTFNVEYCLRASFQDLQQLKAPSSQHLFIVYSQSINQN